MPKKNVSKAKEYASPEDTPGFGLRVAISIMSVFGIVAFFIVWLFFFADRFSIYQNVAVCLVAVLAFIAIMAAGWASWGIKYGRKFDKKCCE
ncbi:MAG: hypothetical protein NTU57_01945 [Candidatus Aenigmarchaeota archaeon]|nr:hypothetical protein [Candidatus Aenigmarchaeota archaeon]